MTATSAAIAQGQRTPLRQLTASLTLTTEVALRFNSNVDVDISCFGLGENGQLNDERYFQFYNQPQAPCGSVVLLDRRAQNQQEIVVKLESLPSDINRLMFVASIDGDGQMGDLVEGHLLFRAEGVEVGRFSFDGGRFSSEKALMVGEFYRRGDWRFNAVGQGYAEGLSAVLRHFGGVESEEAPPDTSPAPAPSTPEPAAVRDVPPPAPVFAPPWFPPGTLTVNGKKVCRRCNREAGLFGGFSYNAQYGRCGSCDKDVQRYLSDFRHRFLSTATRWANQDLDELERSTETARVDPDEAWAFVRGDALSSIENSIAHWSETDQLDATYQTHVYQMVSRARLPQAMAEPLFHQLDAAITATSQRRFRKAFIAACEEDTLTDVRWQALQAVARRERLDFQQALRLVQPEAIGFLQRTLTIAAADGEISDEEEAAFHRLCGQLNLGGLVIQPLLTRIDELRELTRLRQGHLPTVTVSAHLESHEICHLETPATYRKVMARSITPVPGTLIATNKQIHFVSPSGGWKIKLKSIMRVYQQGGALHLELNTKNGSGRYDMSSAPRTEAIIDALVRMEKRQLLVPQTDNPTRHIPQDVRRAVWQRDQGKCTQCQDNNYLEYDHIIPHSQGGANTVNNVQLLCRRCNLEKGDRI